MRAGMSHVGTGDLEGMFLHVPTGKSIKGFESKAAYTRPRKVAQESINCVLPVNIVGSEKGWPQLATQARRAGRVDRAKSKNKSDTHKQAWQYTVLVVRRVGIGSGIGCAVGMRESSRPVSSLKRGTGVMQARRSRLVERPLNRLHQDHLSWRVLKPLRWQKNLKGEFNEEGNYKS